MAYVRQRNGLSPSYAPPQNEEMPENVPQQQPTPQSESPQPPEWNRVAFRDAWMGSGVQNVSDMNRWLQNTGWGSHIKTTGTHGDKIITPTGEVIDAVLSAATGGNKGGPQWTPVRTEGGYLVNQPQPQEHQPQNNVWGYGSMGQSQSPEDLKKQQAIQTHKQFQQQRGQKVNPRYQQQQQQKGRGMGIGPSFYENQQQQVTYGPR